MSEIVTLHHNEPMTTSLAIADGVELEHASVMKLARNHLERLAKFGEVGFEIRFNPQGKPTEFFYLNEQQSTFLVTLMRNTPIVLDFKEALVRAFFELREKAAQPTLMRVSNPDLLIPSHEADKIVASDRVFRAALRTARASGVYIDQAQDYARNLALQVTGVDLIGLMTQNQRSIRPKTAAQGVAEYLALWSSGARPLPFNLSVEWFDSYNDYLRWARENRFSVKDEDYFFDCRSSITWPLRKAEQARESGY